MRSMLMMLCSMLAVTPALAWRSDHPPGPGFGMHGYGVPPLVFGVRPRATVVPAPPMVQAGPRYFCDNPKGQYPQLRTCRHPWRTAPAHADMHQAR